MIKRLFRQFFPSKDDRKRMPLSKNELSGLSELRFFGLIDNDEYQRYVIHAKESAQQGIPRRDLNEWLAYDRVKPEGVPVETAKIFNSVYDWEWYYKTRAKEVAQ